MKNKIALFLLALLIVSCGSSENAKKTAQGVAKNFLEELIEQTGSVGKAILEKEELGFSGSENLNLESKILLSYSQFVDSLKERNQIKLLPVATVLGNNLYRNLAQRQEDTSQIPVASFAHEILEGLMSQKKESIEIKRPVVISIVTYTSYNGKKGLVFGIPGLELLNLNSDEASLLAKELGADYLLSVKLAPYIEKFDPMGDLGSAGVSYRIKVYDDKGTIIIDESSLGDETKFIAFELSFFEKLKMGLYKVFFLFPSNSQKEKLTEIENRLMLDVLIGTQEKLLDKIFKS